MKSILLPLVFMAGVHLAASAQSQSSYWKDTNGKPVTETPSMKSKDGFAGSVIVTSDEDWKAKWDTPPENAPRFTKASLVPYGKKVAILIFFSNPKLDGQGDANVRCDLQIVDPVGKEVLSQKDQVCYTGKIKGSLYSLYLSAPVIEFSGDPGDPIGNWEVNVVLRDAVRGVELPLRTTFGLKEK
jgi:hypothetical protein